MAKTLVDILQVNGFQAVAAFSAKGAMKQVSRRAFGCVLSDIKMPGMDGVELFRKIKTKHPDLPVVLMTAFASDDLIQEGLDAGAIAVLMKPIDIKLFLAFVSSLRKERTVVIVDDDPNFCKTVSDTLGKRGYVVDIIPDPEGVLDGLKKKTRMVVLLDLELYGNDGLENFRKLREEHLHLPVILVSGFQEKLETAIKAALNLSAYTCLYKPIQIEELLRVLEEIYQREMRRMLGNVS